MKKIDVLLASYNGADFIGEQIKSVLINFDYLVDYDCNLLISDDGSTDCTDEIIEKLMRYDSRIHYLGNERQGGVKKNFEKLIMSTSADYVFFCDQDDFWLPTKMKIFMRKFEDLGNNSDLPLLIHSDLCVSDENLSPLHTSMFKYQNLNKSPSFENLLVSNSVTGCVMAINIEMVNILKNSKIEASIMHDWYIALIASSFGVIHHIDSSLILYRQHEYNQIGAKSFSVSSFVKDGGFSRKMTSAKESINKTRNQAKVFFDDFSCELDRDKRYALELYINSFKASWMQRFYLFTFKGFGKKGFYRNCMFFLLYVCGRQA